MQKELQRRDECYAVSEELVEVFKARMLQIPELKAYELGGIISHFERMLNEQIEAEAGKRLASEIIKLKQ